MNHYTPHNFNGDDGDYEAAPNACESETCRHYGDAQLVDLLSPATGEVMATRRLCLAAQRVASQSYGVTLATEWSCAEVTMETLLLAA